MVIVDLRVQKEFLIYSIVQVAFFTTRKVDALEELTWVSRFYVISCWWFTCMFSQNSSFKVAALPYDDIG